MTEQAEPILALCTVEMVKNWLDVNLAVDDPSVDSMIEQAIMEASDQARDIGSDLWTLVNVPTSVSRIVANAVQRFVRNPDGLVTSRSADEGMGWRDVEDADTVRFTEGEVKRIRKAAGLSATGALHSVGVYAYSDRPARDNDWVYDEYGQPFLMPESEQWRFRWRR